MAAYTTDPLPGPPGQNGDIPRVNARVAPEGSLEILSQSEVAELCDTTEGELFELFRRCSLAVLNCGAYIDDARAVFEQYRDFSITLRREQRGIILEIQNAPAHAFVDGQMIRGIREHLFAVLRDILYVNNEIKRSPRFDLESSAGITDVVFNILRNAQALKRHPLRGDVVCWGGHAISREEYDYSKEVGYEMGLRGLNVCTGCGPGAMKGPMKGAAIAHAKQRIRDGRYIGVTEPGIIAAEAPNPIVNELVIMPDIEKRLEAFLRIAHGITVFPGGVGTAEEILFLLGVLMHPSNANIPFPVVLTGPATSAPYFEQLLDFIDTTLGTAARDRLQLIIDDPVAVARAMKEGSEAVYAYRKQSNDAFYFNWALHIDPRYQQPFEATHEAMSALALSSEQPVHERALNLRCIFSGIVAGNVKEGGIRAVEAHGPFIIKGEAALMRPLDTLLSSFARDGRMKLPGTEYRPCYRLVSGHAGR